MVDAPLVSRLRRNEGDPVRPRSLHLAHCTLAFVHVGGLEPPTEFRIFTAGTVDTLKGRFVFDQESIARVLVGYQAAGNELMLDYDHGVFSKKSDPAQAGKAAGWFDLQVRGGELWAVNVRWTPPALEALRNREWRYMSPAFETEGDRIVGLINVALTNLPATKNLQPLIAASVLAAATGDRMDPKKVAEALDALQSGDVEACAEILKGMIADAASGGADAQPEAEAPADAPPDGMMAEGAPAPMAPAAEEQKKEASAVAANLLRATGKESITEALSDVAIWKASHLALEAENAKLRQERAALEAAERRSLVASLVRLGAEIPATAWADDTAERPCARLASEPLGDLKTRVAMFSAARGKVSAPKTPTPGGRTVNGVTISQDEIQRVEARARTNGVDSKIALANYAQIKARQLAASASGEN